MTANVIYTSQRDVMEQQVRRARELADFVVVGVHWGVEDSHKITQTQRDLAQQLSDWGVEYGVTETVEKNSKLFSSDYIEISSVSEIQTELIRYGEQILQQVHLSKNSSNSAIVRRTKEYIKAHYQDDELCLEQIADALDVNLQYMCFLFKKQTDTTIGAYILQTRMEMAGRLFQRTNYNVTEVAQRVGFFDVSYFSKCFKKYFGVSPKQYQNVSSNYLKTT